MIYDEMNNLANIYGVSCRYHHPFQRNLSTFPILIIHLENINGNILQRCHGMVLAFCWVWMISLGRIMEIELSKEKYSLVLWVWSVENRSNRYKKGHHVQDTEIFTIWILKTSYGLFCWFFSLYFVILLFF